MGPTHRPRAPTAWPGPLFARCRAKSGRGSPEPWCGPVPRLGGPQRQSAARCAGGGTRGTGPRRQGGSGDPKRCALAAGDYLFRACMRRPQLVRSCCEPSSAGRDGRPAELICWFGRGLAPSAWARRICKTGCSRRPPHSRWRRSRPRRVGLHLRGPAPATGARQRPLSHLAVAMQAFGQLGDEHSLAVAQGPGRRHPASPRRPRRRSRIRTKEEIPPTRSSATCALWRSRRARLPTSCSPRRPRRGSRNQTNEEIPLPEALRRALASGRQGQGRRHPASPRRPRRRSRIRTKEQIPPIRSSATCARCG